MIAERGCRGEPAENVPWLGGSRHNVNHQLPRLEEIVPLSSVNTHFVSHRQISSGTECAIDGCDPARNAQSPEWV